MTTPAAAGPTIVDWLTLGFAGLAAIASVATTYWTIRRQEREVLDAHIEWQWFGSGPEAEIPFVYVYNRSTSPVTIIDVSYLQGFWRKKIGQGVALRYDDPGDLNFPYSIASENFIKLYLDPNKAERLRISDNAISNLFRRSPIWLQLKTMRGKKVVISAIGVLPWNTRPDWWNN